MPPSGVVRRKYCPAPLTSTSILTRSTTGAAVGDGEGHRPSRLPVEAEEGERSGVSLSELMADKHMEAAECYATRGELQDVGGTLDAWGYTTLYLAAHAGHRTIVTELSDAGTNMNNAGETGMTSLCGARDQAP